MYWMAKLTLEFNMDKTVQYVQRIALDLRPRNTKVTNEGSMEDLISKHASLLLSLYSYHYNYSYNYNYYYYYCFILKKWLFLRLVMFQLSLLIPLSCRF